MTISREPAIRVPGYRPRPGHGPVDLSRLEDPVDLSRLDDPFTPNFAREPRRAIRYIEPANVREPLPGDARVGRVDRRTMAFDALRATFLIAGIVGALMYGPGAAEAFFTIPPPSVHVRPAAVVPSRAPSPSPRPSAAPPSAAVRASVDIDLLGDRSAVIFASQANDKMCASSAVQMIIEMLNDSVDTSEDFQFEIRSLIERATNSTDSQNGGAGPQGIATVISDLTGVQYEVRSAETRAEALHESAAILTRTNKPIILFTWRGAHTWVMTGYRADADPTVFDDATIEGTYILDPWYPRVSSTWGRSDKPGTFQDSAEMKRNYLAWKRPEGRYPSRDGRYLYIAPVEE